MKSDLRDEHRLLVYTFFSTQKKFHVHCIRTEQLIHVAVLYWKADEITI